MRKGEKKPVEYKLFYEPFEHQREFHNSTERHVLLVTGFGGGKTLAGCMKALKASMLNPNIMCMIVSPSYKMAKNTVIQTLHEICSSFFYPALPMNSKDGYSYNKAEMEFRFHLWDGIIKIASADNPDSLKGPNLAFALLDEPGLMKVEAYNYMLSRIRHPQAELPQICLTGTPEGINWLSDLWDFAKKANIDMAEKAMKPKYKLINAKTSDNKKLDPEFIEALYARYDINLVKAYINGEFVNMQGMSAYHCYSKDDSIIKDFEPDPNKPFHLGMDFNFSPMASVLCQEATVNGSPCVVAFKEFWYENCDTNFAAERIWTWMTEQFGNSFKLNVYPDPACKNRAAHGAGKTDLFLLRQIFEHSKVNIWLPKRSPMRKDRLNAVNSMLKNGFGVRRLFFTESCKHLDNDFTKATMDEYLNGNFKDKDIGHISDALGYYIFYNYPLKPRSGLFSQNKIF